MTNCRQICVPDYVVQELHTAMKIIGAVSSDIVYDDDLADEMIRLGLSAQLDYCAGIILGALSDLGLKLSDNYDPSPLEDWDPDQPRCIRCPGAFSRE